MNARTHWHASAAQWAAFGSPLRPCGEDVRIFEELLAGTDLLRAGERKRAWLLGVTPEIAAAPWLKSLDLVAADRVRTMIDSAWPGNTIDRQAICADWLRAPFAEESFDLVIGDGCLTTVGIPDELGGLLAAVHRALRSKGYLLLRLFCRPDVAETPDAVIAALHSGAIGSFHAFKWRLAMAVQSMAKTPDIAVSAIWQAWQAARIDALALARTRGWSPAQIGTIEFYRESPARYNFLQFDAIIGHLRRAGFDLTTSRRGNYELAERCPQVLLRKRPDLGAANPA